MWLFHSEHTVNVALVWMGRWLYLTECDLVWCGNLVLDFRCCRIWSCSGHIDLNEKCGWVCARGWGGAFCLSWGTCLGEWSVSLCFSERRRVICFWMGVLWTGFWQARCLGSRWEKKPAAELASSTHRSSTFCLWGILSNFQKWRFLNYVMYELLINNDNC